MSIVYISGGMAGYDGLNEPAFRAAAQTILDRGDAPLVPHDIKPHRHPGRECAPVYGAEAAEGGHDGGCYLRADFWRAVEQRAARFAGGLDQGDPGCDHCGGDGEIGSKGDLTEPCPCRSRR